jgi:hypothetical protein
MAIIQGTCDSFRTELLSGTHAFGTDVIKIALYDADTATITPAITTAYTSTGEIVSSGYTAGGIILTEVTVLGAPAVGYVVWNAATWTLPFLPGIDGALIYNASKSNKAIAVLNFGTTRYPNSSGVFTLQYPYDPINNAVIRLA